jgi:hypothetical protein
VAHRLSDPVTGGAEYQAPRIRSAIRPGLKRAIPRAQPSTCTPPRRNAAIPRPPLGQPVPTLSVVGLATRVCLGIVWIRAGWADVWGAESSAVVHHGGSGEAGSATRATSAPWRHGILTGAVAPHAGAIWDHRRLLRARCRHRPRGRVPRPTSTPAGLGLLLPHVRSGTASACAFCALSATVIVTTWRTSRSIGAALGLAARDGAARRPGHTGREAPASESKIPDRCVDRSDRPTAPEVSPRLRRTAACRTRRSSGRPRASGR